jgi:hypothetical protein
MKQNLDEIVKNLREWSEDNQEKRAFVILAVENVKEGDEGDAELACTAGVCGSDMIVTTSLADAFADEENPVGNAIKKAIKFAALKAISKQMDEILENESEEESENAEQETEQTAEAEEGTQDNGNN